MIADVVLGIQHGDEAKGKVTHYLSKNKDYTHVLRFNGGCNAGHTIYHEGRKFVTHHIPAGVFYGIKSIIGPGCVISPKHFFEEVRELQEAGIQIHGKLFIAKNAHVITEMHLNEEITENKIGTTRRGNGPAYRDKYARKGIRAGELNTLSSYMIDLYEEFHGDQAIKVLCEGAQGFGLDVDWGDYPYVTSSHCGLGSVFLNAVSPRWLRDVWGVAKIYETYVGAKSFEPDEPIFQALRDLGEEYGATTGRPRQCNWLNLDELRKNIILNSVNKLVINKMDIMRDLNQWKLYHNSNLVSFENENEICNYIIAQLPNNIEIFFSDNKNRI
jgi:adenylosuccinate synthase